MSTTYVSIDLETTGLDPHKDEIIEVGAVKFRGGEVLETYHSMVKPRAPLPSAISLLTGIMPDELRDAPPFAAIAGDLILFLDDATIVGQNVSFDLSCLAAAGLELPNPVCDTLQLAKILAPYLVERNLTALTAYFEVEYPTKHRALADAEAARGVFLALRERARDLDASVLYTLCHLGTGAPWALTRFFQEVLEERGLVDATPAAPRPKRPTPIAVVGRDENARSDARRSGPAVIGESIDVDWLGRLLSPDGGLSQTFLDYEHRPEQAKMLEAVAEALNDDQHLLVEAGTGTGKSLAYLLPSFVHSISSGQPVVISTHTIALQEQLLTKDIPLALQALRAGLQADPTIDMPPVEEIRYALLKGRSNYLCLRRWQGVLQGGLEGLDPDFLARIAVWLSTTQTGDRAELNLNSHDSSQWARLSSEPENCPANQCLALKGGQCFLQKARQAAQEADVLVVNHALLVSDMKAGNTLLPEHNALIIDEAHHLEDIATDQLGSHTTVFDFYRYLDRLFSTGPGGRAQGLVPQIEAAFSAGGPMFGAHAHIGRLVGLRDRVPTVKRQVDILFEHLGLYVRDRGEGASEYNKRVRLTSAARHNEPWSRIEQAWEDLRKEIQSLQNDLDTIRNAVEAQAQIEPDPYMDLLAETVGLHFSGQALLEQGATVIGRADPAWITWLSLEGNGETGMFAAPLSIGPSLQKELFGKLNTVVLTSATLRVGDDFSYVSKQLGLESPRELAVSSPFPYRRNALLLTPQDMPEPANSAFDQKVEDAIAGLCAASQGRALVLFTSHAALQRAQRGLQPTLEALGLQLLAQGVNGTPQQLLDRFRTQPKSVLFGTSSFWEGVDVVGDALSLLIITRLPFPVPTEPVFAARSENFDDPFGQYTVPQAVLRLRQGFGRLIRSKRDRGVAVILDPRVLTKQYGRVFLESLPPAAWKGECMVREMPALVSQWLAPRD